MAKTDKREQQRKAKQQRKAEQYAARKDPKDSNTKYAQRRAARARGVPMTSRSHEGRPWWTFTIGTHRIDRDIERFAARLAEAA